MRRMVEVSWVLDCQEESKFEDKEDILCCTASQPFTISLLCCLAVTHLGWMNCWLTRLELARSRLCFRLRRGLTISRILIISTQGSRCWTRDWASTCGGSFTGHGIIVKWKVAKGPFSQNWRNLRNKMKAHQLICLQLHIVYPPGQGGDVGHFTSG